MKSLFSVLLLAVVFSFLGRAVFAQGDLPSPVDDGGVLRMEQGSPYDERWGRPLPLTPDTARPLSPYREARALKKGILAPSSGDRMAFAEFLRRRHTGLIRLLPREVYDSQTNHTKSPVSIRGGGAYYSFAMLTHFYGYGSDLELSRDWFSVGFAGADYGMLTMLGDVPLDQISERDPRAQFLANYRPPAPEHLARAEARRFMLRGGVTFDGLNYQSRQPVFEHWTYLLRSISYRNSDVLVAFRVVRKDNDGSVIIAWKLLKQYPTPELTQTTSRSK